MIVLLFDLLFNPKQKLIISAVIARNAVTKQAPELIQVLLVKITPIAPPGRKYFILAGLRAWINRDIYLIICHLTEV
jgi:hypothetical protein